jgi:uncharacterized protein (TIGR02117 family)
VLLALLLGACSPVTSDRPIALPAPGEPARTVWVVGHGWHVGLAVRRTDVRADVWPDAPGDVEHVEVGWGDADFYPTATGTSGLAIRAAVASRGSVLHVAGFNGPVARFFAGAPVYELRLTPAGFDDLGRFVAAAYARDARGAAQPLGPGLYGASRFYAARERYSAFSNSNGWAARALRAGGVPVRPVWFADSLLGQVKSLGNRVN